MSIKNSLIKILTLISTIFLVSISITGALFCKNTGLNYYNLEEDNGYTLFGPENSFTTYLINYKKEVVHTWESNYLPGHSVYLLENGNLLRTVFLGPHPIFLSGGMGGGVLEIDWNGSIVWDFKYSSNNYLSHHDIEYLPNGNILMIAWEAKNYSEVISAGRNPNITPMLGLWPDHVVEVKPTGPTSGEIVWQWHIWDHLIQDYDPTKENYGVVEEHPELIDINYGRATMDWNHINSIDYNEEFDQIILSVKNFNEIWIIDHSTTTEEAAGHTGGNSGKGGDLLYRWGNPAAYRRGTVNDQKFFGQHDARWIEPGCPGEGNILVFNNGLGRPGLSYSSVEEITPPVDSNGNYYIEPGCAFGPEEQTWIYTAKNPTDFYSYMISGSQRIANGNTVICDGKKGIFFEVTLQKETVWEYVNPFPSLSLNAVFTIQRYPSNYSGLKNLFQQPKNPEKPNGTINGLIGIVYNYTTVTTDPQDDQIYYMFDWGDRTKSGWIGPFNSGETISSSHIWRRRGKFNVKVMAKDIYGHQSGWSEPLSIYMPRCLILTTPVLNLLLKNNCFLRFLLFKSIFRR